MWQGLAAPIDLYCERTGPEFWSEPLNALSNIAFLLAGLWGLREARRRGAGTFAEVLAWWVVAIGIGSALFHTFATRGMVLADVLPIAGFTLAYTIYNLRRFLDMDWTRTLVIFLGFYAVAGLITWAVPEWLRTASNGTTGYLPPFLALAFFGAWVAWSGNRAGWYNLAGSCIFVISVLCRMIDPLVCAGFPIGTHFLWHLLNGLMLAVLLAAAARCAPTLPLVGRVAERAGKARREQRGGGA